MKKHFFFSFLFFAFLTSFAQEPAKKPLKVGVVLSGGGAKGFAHIGVLKVLDEAGVKISFIGGTSMGAVVGGLYASGYSARQIDSIFKTTDFDELIKDFIPRSSKSFYEKRNDELYAFTLPFDKFKIGIPTALSKGMYNYNLLTRLTYNVRHIRDFNKLPIPFLCTATNIETGKEVVLNSGFLSQAMLASSAFPYLFSPVEIDGQLLVDGGVTNNYPVDEVRNLGADIIIGVDVQDDLRDRVGLQDASKMLVQISNLQMQDQMKQKIAATDIYIKPDITGFGFSSFNDGSNIIKKGEEAVFPVYEKIKLLVDQSNPYRIKNKPAFSDTLDLKNIYVNNLDSYTRSYVLGKLGFRTREEIKFSDIKIGIDNLSATQNFSAITYTLDQNGSKEDLNINLTENKVKTFLKFGLHYDGLYKSGLLVNVTQKKTFFKNDIASFDVLLGDNFRTNFDYYIDNGFYWSFGFKSRFNGFNKDIATDFKNGLLLTQLNLNSINIDFTDFSNQAYLQTVFAQRFLIGAGVEYKFLKIQAKTLPGFNPTLDESDYLSAFGYLKYDSFDNKYFPKKGWYFSSDFQSYLYSTDYTNQFKPFSIAKGDAGFAQTFYKKATLKVQTEAGFVIGNQSVSFFDFILGGYGFNTVNNIRHFYGYDFLSVAADSYIKSTFTLDYEPFKKHHLNFSANYANIQNGLFRTTDWIAIPKYSGYAAGYGLETIFGPMEVKYSWSPELSRGFVWFTAGFWF